jgi:hypothetical protein
MPHGTTPFASFMPGASPRCCHTVMAGYTVMAGLVPAIRSGTLPRRMAGTSPAMTNGTSGDGRSLVRAAGIMTGAATVASPCFLHAVMAVPGRDPGTAISARAFPVHVVSSSSVRQSKLTGRRIDRHTVDQPPPSRTARASSGPTRISTSRTLSTKPSGPPVSRVFTVAAVSLSSVS